MLIVRCDADPRHNMTERAIDIAIASLEAAAVPIPDNMHVLNQWPRNHPIAVTRENPPIFCKLAMVCHYPQWTDLS